jgi:hypothetical protein
VLLKGVEEEEVEEEVNVSVDELVVCVSDEVVAGSNERREEEVNENRDCRSMMEMYIVLQVVLQIYRQPKEIIIIIILII